MQLSQPYKNLSITEQMKNQSIFIALFVFMGIAFCFIMNLLALIGVLTTVFTASENFESVEQAATRFPVILAESFAKYDFSHIQNPSDIKTFMSILSVLNLIGSLTLIFPIVALIKILKDTWRGRIFTGNITKNVRILFISSTIVVTLFSSNEFIANVFFSLFLPTYDWDFLQTSSLLISALPLACIIYFSTIDLVLRYGEKLQKESDETL